MGEMLASEATQAVQGGGTAGLGQRAHVTRRHGESYWLPWQPCCSLPCAAAQPYPGAAAGPGGAGSQRLCPNHLCCGKGSGRALLMLLLLLLLGWVQAGIGCPGTGAGADHNCYCCCCRRAAAVTPSLCIQSSLPLLRRLCLPARLSTAALRCGFRRTAAQKTCSLAAAPSL